MDTADTKESKYYLETDTVNLTQVEITRGEFDNLKKSKAILAAALSLEERYELLIGNYISFEKTLTDYSIENMTRFKWSDDNHYYSASFMESLNLNRHIINLLTSARMYMDQTLRDIRTCMSDGKLAEDFFLKAKSEQYDKHFEYKFMEALRNHVQHFGFPASQVTANNRFDKLETGARWSYTVEVTAFKKTLSENKKFSKKVLAEMPERVEIGRSTRVYLASISIIQERIRETIEPFVDEARSHIEEAFSQFEPSPIGNKMVHVTHREKQGANGRAGEEIESFNLLLIFDEIRKQLQGLNIEMRNLPRRIAANYYQKSN